MSSLHQDHLLVEGPEPVTGTASTVAPARGTSRRPVEEKATSTVPTQRKGKSQRTGSAPTSTEGSTSAPAVPRTRRPARSTGSKAAASADGTLASRARTAATSTAAATTRAASAKAASATAAAKPATTATATAKPAADVTPVVVKATGAATQAVPEAGPDASSTAGTKQSSAARYAAVKTTTPAGEPVATSAAVRPTPFKRAAAAVPAEPETVVVPGEVAPVEAPATEDVASIAESPRARFLRRRPPSIRRRPTLYLAAALVGAVSVSSFTSGNPNAQATDTMSHSVSVAQELGITAQPTDALTDTTVTERLGALAVSRNARAAQQDAAARAQADADSAAAAAAAAAAAEAARPKAILPVTGARMTSTFGMRWGTLHAGIDLAAPMRTPEMAAVDGVVLEAGPASGFGLAVYIQHENGDVTVYGHMDQILVQAGQVVKAGDTIALLGNRGQTTGPHLHFEVHVGGINGAKIDPLPWLRERGVAI